jgi:hypothetical protein
MPDLTKIIRLVDGFFYYKILVSFLHDVIFLLTGTKIVFMSCSMSTKNKENCMVF